MKVKDLIFAGALLLPLSLNAEALLPESCLAKLPPGTSTEQPFIFTFNDSTQTTAAAEILDSFSLLSTERTTSSSAQVLKNLGIITLNADAVGILMESSAPSLDELCKKALTVEPDIQMKVEGATEKYSARMWGLQNEQKTVDGVDVDIDFPSSYPDSLAPVVIGVVDTGVDYTHPQLKDRLWRNPREVRNGIDDDKNGYVDDLYGVNFACEQTFLNICTEVKPVSEVMDLNSHGTHTSGTIAASASTLGNGVVGIAPNAQIMPLRFLGAEGAGGLSGALATLEYALVQKRAGVNIRALNNSWGGSVACPSSLQTAITKLNDAGVLFIASAGNDGKDIGNGSPSSPAGCNNVLTVAALTSSGELANFSNYSSSLVEVAAPGAEIYSTIPFNIYPYRGIASYSGTSMSCPHVAGVAAVLFGLAPSLTPQQATTLISQSVKPFAALKGKMGNPGIISLSRAVKLLSQSSQEGQVLTITTVQDNR